MASLNHNFFLSESDIFLRGALASSGKTGGGFSVFARRVVEATLRRTKHDAARSQPSSFGRKQKDHYLNSNMVWLIPQVVRQYI
jgi:hypothetical protein